MRLFFAVDFSHAVKETIREAIEVIPIYDPPWRWVSSANLHMTLKFLGERPEEDVAILSECAEAVCRETVSFSIRVGRLGGFPNLSRPRVLFYRVEEGAESLAGLARTLDEMLTERLGIRPEKRPFRAHATVARIKKDVPPRIIRLLKAAPPLANASQRVECMLLMRSKLHPEGAIYHPVKEFALSKSKC